MSGGWGSGWGLTPWGGFLLPATITPPPPAPCPPRFDVYCFCNGPTMGGILVDPYVEITPLGSPQFTINADDDLCVQGIGTAPLAADAFLTILHGVPDAWTLQVEATFKILPVDFTDLVFAHVYFGTADTTGLAAGLFVSAAGIAYAGAVTLSSPANNLVLNGSFQVIPGTAGAVQPNKPYTFRIAADKTTSTVYVFATETALLPIIGDQLIAVLPGISTSGVVGDSTVLSVRGTDVRPTRVCFNSVCLASGLYMPNVPPIADAGRDQALRMCTVGKLDGLASYDPDGGSLTYSWRFIDAPINSSFAVNGDDGQTFPLPAPTGFTSKFYSAELGVASLSDPILPGDVLLLNLPGNPSPPSIVSTGVDGGGFFIEVINDLLPDSLVNVHFKVLRQRFLSSATSAVATFFPDVPGIYKFDLVVFDGQFPSEPATVISNVLESQIPKGCIPDLGFVWQYLSDFWKLVEDRERIQVLWEGMAQVAAAELFTLWQVDYSKSLRDVQRSFQRRWLHYDLKLPEPVPDLTVVRRMYGGVISNVAIPTTVGGVQGTVLEIASPVHATLQIPFTMNNPYTAVLLQQLLQVKLKGADARYQVLVLGDSSLLLLAPFAFQIGANTTLPIFDVGDFNVPAAGASGIRLSPRTYLVDRSLAGLDIQLNDLLVVGGEGYRISRVVNDPSDTYRFQRVIVQTDLPILPGTTWSIPSHVSSRFLSFYDGLLTQGDVATFEVIDQSDNSMALLNVPVVGACAAEVTKLGVDLTGIDRFLSLPTLTAHLAYVLRRTHVPASPLVVDIPCLQEHIKANDDGAVLRRNVDFFIEQFRGQNSIRFVTAIPGNPNDVWEGGLPAPRMWAEVTYLDNNPTIEANFGIPAGFTLDQLAELSTDLDYLSAVRGLWYSYLNGPTLFNLRAGSQILLGLPFAEEAGVIQEIRTDFSPTQGRILIQDLSNTAIVRSYSFPSALPLEVNPTTKKVYAAGDKVAQLAPLVKGAEVLDYINSPTWFQGLLNQGSFFEVEKFHKFMVRIDSAAFSLSSLMFVMNFIRRVKPTYTFPLFVVHNKLPTADVSVTDLVVSKGRLKLNAGACFPNFGATQIFDDFSPDGSFSVHNQFDANSNQADTPPTSPVPDVGITWGFDKMFLCPDDFIRFSWNISHPGGVVAFDSGFSFDATNSQGFVFDDTGVGLVSSGAGGHALPGSYIIQANGTLTSLYQIVQGTTVVTTFEYVFALNGIDVATLSATINVGGAADYVTPAPAVPVTAGDILTLRIRAVSDAPAVVDWAHVRVTVLQSPAVAFAFDIGLPAGVYSFSRTV